MFRFIGSLIGSLILAGLGLALLWAFDWDLAAIVQWAWRLGSSLIDLVAQWFTNASWFQQAVSR